MTYVLDLVTSEQSNDEIVIELSTDAVMELNEGAHKVQLFIDALKKAIEQNENYFQELKEKIR